MIGIRPATPADAPAIARVQVETWRTAYRGIVPDAFLDEMSPDDRTASWAEIVRKSDQATFVAESREHDVVGFANGGPERESPAPDRGELYALYVLSEHHGHAIGRRLTATFARWLVGSGYESMAVWVLESNPSRGFYERLGGMPSGRKQIEIGGQTLTEVAYEWKDVRSLAAEVVDEEFERAVAYVLEKNAELYRRLSGCPPKREPD